MRHHDADAVVQREPAGAFAQHRRLWDESEIRQQGGRKIFAFLAASQIHVWIPFAVNENFKGGIGLGVKMLGDPYTPDDQELLSTLANQLTIALDNALAYMEIHQLNVGLEATVQERTAELRSALEKLTEVNQQLELHNRFIRETFGRYLSNAVVSSLLESPTGLQLGGERRHVTILMSDLRGFTSLVGHLAPEQVVTIINRYLGAMVDVILQYEGTINEFIGDAIFVIFGAPLWWPDHAQRAMACAVAMQLAMAEVNAQNQRDGLPEVEMGIGVNTGEVVVGNLGSYKRTKYGVLGTHVNLTARIESYTIGGQILISESTLQDVGPILRIAQQMEITAEKVREIIKVSQEPVSLETPIGEEDDSHLGDFIEDHTALAPADAASHQLLKEQVEDVLDSLTERERKVLQLRFGLDDGRARTLEEVGREFKVTRERIRQIEAKALRKLRHPSRSRKLKDYLD